MTITIKDTPDAAGLTKPTVTPPAAPPSGPSSQKSENTPGQSSRSNPVCLEVPITLRSLPGEDANAAGVSGPTRQEGRSVIVFDNGGVIRIPNPLPPGQKIILSNRQGRDVVCRVSAGRNLPNIKGYIEVEFLEAVSDFWQIHQTSEQSSAPIKAPSAPPATSAPIAQPPQAAQAQPLPKELVPTHADFLRPAAPDTESKPPTSGAPTFEDIAGLVLMSPSAATREKKAEPAIASSTSKSKVEPAPRPAEASKPVSLVNASPTIPELVAEKPVPPVAAELIPTVSRSVASIGSFTGKTPAFSVASSSYSSSDSGESRGKTPLIIGIAALLFAGLGGGYYFLFAHHGSGPDQKGPVAAISQPAAPPPQDAVPAAVSQPAAEPPASPVESPAVSAAAPVAAVAPTDSQAVRTKATSSETKQQERTPTRNQTITNLKLSSPIAPGRNLSNVPEGAPTGSVEMESAAAMAPGGIAPGTFAARAENQPAPPPSLPAPVAATPATKVMSSPKLISSTRPVYPVAAKTSNVQGTVAINVTVDEKGNVVAAKAVSGPLLLRQPAVDAVKHWKYAPALADGKPTSSQVNINVDFRLK